MHYSLLATAAASSLLIFFTPLAKKTLGSHILEDIYYLHTCRRCLLSLGKTFFYSKNSTRITCKTHFYLLCMAHYLFSHWSTQQLLFNPFSLIFLQDVGIICEQLPALKALNLSYNLMSPYKSELPLLKSIRVLVLNNTGVDWEQVSFYVFSQLTSLAYISFMFN